MPKQAPSKPLDTAYVVPAALFALLLALPFQWLAMTHVGPLALKPSGAVLMLFTLVMMSTRRLRQALMIYVMRFWPIVVAYIAYLLFSVITLGWNADPMSSAPAIVKNAMYFTYFVVVGAAVATGERRATTQAIRRGVRWGTVLFLLIAMITFAMMGRNLVVDYVSAIARADINTLQYKFYPHLFNFHSGAVQGDDGYVHHALRNTLMGCFILFFILNQALDRSARGATRLVRTGTSLLLLAIVITSVSRSNWIALSLVLGGALLAFLPRASVRSLTPTRVMLALATLSVVSLVSVVCWDTARGALDILSQRLSIMTQDSRLALFSEAWRSIAVNPVTGYGIGAELPIAGNRVHNLFVGAWYEGGITVLLLAVIYYVTLVVYALGFHRRMLSARVRWGLAFAPQWVFVLPVLPLFRAMLSGEGGNFTLVEWICLAFFFGLMLAQERTAEPMSQHIRERQQVLPPAGAALGRTQG